MDAGLGSRITDDTDGLSGSLAGTSIGLGSLPTNRQTTQVPHSAIALDALQTLQVHTDFAAQVTFDHILAVLNSMDDLRELLLGEILGADAGFNISLREDDLSV